VQGDVIQIATRMMFVDHGQSNVLKTRPILHKGQLASSCVDIDQWSKQICTMVNNENVSECVVYFIGPSTLIGNQFNISRLCDSQRIGDVSVTMTCRKICECGHVNTFRD